MTFTTPLALLLLVLLPYTVWAAWLRRGADGRLRPRSGWLGLALRLVIVSLLVFSLAGVQIVRAVDDLAVIFLVDNSDSMGTDQRAQAEQFVREALAAMGPDDRAGVVLFGGNALVEQPLRAAPEDGSVGDLPPFTSQPQGMNTDLAEAIRLSLALLPTGSAHRVVVLSDGATTTGDTAGAAQLAAATGVSLDTVFLPRTTAGEEIILRDVRAPSRVAEGERFDLEVAVDSTVATPATLRVLADGQIVYQEQVELLAGPNNYLVPLPGAEPAFTRYRVQIAPDAALDTFPQNNERAAFTEIGGQPRILVVGGAEPDETTNLRQALDAAGYQVARLTPVELPAALAQLAEYAAIVLVNVDAGELSPRKMETLQTYVRDLGGGLVAVGGPDSFGMGGYFETPLEAALPLDMRIDDEERFPSVSLALVLDRSGSMGQDEGGVAKIQLAAEGAVRAVQLLNDDDEITVIPVDTVAENVIGPVTLTERAAAVDQIRQIGAGGGGIYMRTGLETAAEALAQSDKQVKHIIVLADGADAEEKEGVPDLIRDLVVDGVTVSMVSIGDGPDTLWLQQMAQIGNGRFHFTDRAANLPQIFTRETAAIQRSYLVEERFFPQQVRESATLSGITETPALFGYIATAPKDTAQVILETAQGDPLLASWQYGLGRAAAWTSDATGRWASDWVQWPGFAPFWAQLVQSTITRSADSALEATVRYEDETARLVVDARSPDDLQFLTDLSLRANVVDPAGEAQELQLAQVAPGRYEAEFSPTTEGAYFLGVGPTEGSAAADDASLRQTTGWVLGYSPEYLVVDSNPRLLSELAGQTGGRVLALDSEAGLGPEAVFDHNLAAAPVAQPIWPWLTLIAVLLLPLDVAARRLVLTRRDVNRAMAGVRQRLTPETAEPAPRSAAMSQLFQAKDRAGGRTGRGALDDTTPQGTETPVARARTPETATPPPESPTERGAEPAQGKAAASRSEDRPEVEDTLAARLRQRRQNRG